MRAGSERTGCRRLGSVNDFTLGLSAKLLALAVRRLSQLGAHKTKFLPEHDAYMMRRAVIGEVDIHAVTCERCAIDFNRRHPAHYSVWILDDDFVARRVIAKGDPEAPPCTRDTWVEVKPRAAQTET